MEIRPRRNTANVTAGLKWPPEMWPPAKIIAARTPPIATGASAAPVSTAVQTVKTRKNVPMNSTRYLRISVSGGTG